jgi:acyl-coenzyme A synthetase/AMP-(fatty) acid ligase
VLCIVKGIQERARENGGAPALITGSRSLSYAQLLDTIARIAHFFLRSSIPRGSKLFINIADADLRLIVCIAAMHCRLVPFFLLDIGDLGAEVDYDYVVGAPIRQHNDVAPDIVIDPAALADPADPRLPYLGDGADDDLLFIGATTGTTGRRKLVAETWRTYHNRLNGRGDIPGITDPRMPEGLRWSSRDRLLYTMGDVTYAGAGMALCTLATGATHVRTSRDIHEALRLINTYSVNFLVITPATLAELMNGMDRHGVRCESVKRIVVGGSLFEPALVERMAAHFTADLFVSYGSTEVGLVSIGKIRPDTYRFGDVGHIAPGLQLISAGSRAEPAPLVIVRRREHHVPFYVGGRIVSSADPFYTMPDLGYAEGGRLFVIGRDDEVYSYNGNKTAFSLIDSALRRVPHVSDVAVVSGNAIGDPLGLVIGVVAAADLDLRPLRERVLEVAEAKQAGDRIRLFRLETIPRNAFGKTDRNAVVAAYLRSAAHKDWPAPA